jgi:hypothetical protein
MSKNRPYRPNPLQCCSDTGQNSDFVYMYTKDVKYTSTTMYVECVVLLGNENVWLCVKTTPLTSAMVLVRGLHFKRELLLQQ